MLKRIFIVFGIFFEILACGSSATDTNKNSTQIASTEPASIETKETKPESNDTKVSRKKIPQDKAPKEDKKLSASEEKNYRKFLEEGRKLHRAKEYIAAMEAFQKALDVYPDDSRALSELGWAAFFADELELAKSNTTKALERTSDSNLRGSTLYNLGRIYEAQNKKEEAILSYQQSLSARSNDIVRARLASLDKEAAKQKETLKAQPLQGPYASLEDFCKLQKKQNKDYEYLWCDPASKKVGEYSGSTEIANPPAPYKSIRLLLASGLLFGVEEGEEVIPGLGEATYFLALELSDGWYVSPSFAYVYNPGAFGIFQSLEGLEFSLQDLVPGDAKEIVYRYAYSESDSNMAGAEIFYSETKHQLICGVGLSQKPSCLLPIMLENKSGTDYELWEEKELGPKPAKSSEGFWEISFTSEPDGKFTLEQKTLSGDQKSLPKETKKLLGTHPLVFP